MKKVSIGHQIIGGQRTFIIAELSANHLFDKMRTLRLIEAVAKSGADALKVQTLTADSMTIDSRRGEFIVTHDCPWKGMSLYELYQETPLPLEWHRDVFECCAELGLICFSTPYDESSLEFLRQYDPPAYKIASFEAVDLSLIQKVAEDGKPVIISTGISSEEEIREALQSCYDKGNRNVVLLKCTSAYPAPIDQINLSMIPDMRKRFDCHVGLSDHTLGSMVSLGAVCLGAAVIEKHVTLKRSDGGPDAGFSMEVDEFAEMVGQIRQLEKTLGSVDYTLSQKTLENRLAFGRSLFVVKDIKAGEAFTKEYVRSIRPGYGLSPKFLDLVCTYKAKQDIARGTPLSWQLVNKEL